LLTLRQIFFINFESNRKHSVYLLTSVQKPTLFYSSLLDYPAVAYVFINSNTTLSSSNCWESPQCSCSTRLNYSAKILPSWQTHVSEICVQRWNWFFLFWAYISNSNRLKLKVCCL